MVTNSQHTHEQGLKGQLHYPLLIDKEKHIEVRNGAKR